MAKITLLSRSSPRHFAVRRCLTVAFTIIASLVVALLADRIAEADSDALWNKVVQVCVKSDPARDPRNPCDVVREDADYVLVKDLCGPTQYLLLPIRKLSGIESSELVAAPNYFALAWENRDEVAKRAGRTLAADDYALALNSIDRRSQNQFHIHIDLARAGLSDALKPYRNNPVGQWSVFRYNGHDYHLSRLTDLLRQNPIELVRARVTASGGAMEHQTIGLVGATFADASAGFYLLNGEYDGKPDGGGWAEELEIDHPRSDCGYRRVPAP